MTTIAQIAAPVLIDTTKSMMDQWPGSWQIITDANGQVIALCPFSEEKLPNGQFSYAAEIQLAINSGAAGGQLAKFPYTTTAPTHHTIQSATSDISPMTDAQVAYDMVMIGRNDLDAEPRLHRARDRMLKLSAQVFWLRAKLRALRHAAEGVRRLAEGRDFISTNFQLNTIAGQLGNIVSDITELESPE